MKTILGKKKTFVKYRKLVQKNRASSYHFLCKFEVFGTHYSKFLVKVVDSNTTIKLVYPPNFILYFILEVSMTNKFMNLFYISLHTSIIHVYS